MVLFEQTQIDTLRYKCDHAVKRIWIASPFIGALKDVQKIIGGKWKLPSVDCRILTDVDAGFIQKDTFDEFENYQVEVRSLESIHSKIYIVDDWCLVTSANLTGTAFFCRYEMGVAMDNVKDVEAAFLKWWGLGRCVTSLPKKQNKALVDYQDGKQFSRKFKAPAYKTGKQDKYDAACEKYLEFASLYNKITGRNPKMVKDGFTLLQEVDYLFNFLYHEHPNTPSNGVLSPRLLTQAKRDQEIRRYFKDMCQQYDVDPQEWRLERSSLIQKLLDPGKIDKISKSVVKQVIESLHCLHSYSFNRPRFLDPSNNSLQTIRSSWKTLLHTGAINRQKIDQVISSLKFFGLSSAQELIGWYYPDKYPMMNGNSDCGMRFFGYNV